MEPISIWWSACWSAQAGGAYVPLDPFYPTQRLAFMLEDAKVTVILTQQDLLEKLPPPIVSYGARVLCCEPAEERIDSESEQNPVQETTPANLAYVIYTSGSTGKPKGTGGSCQCCTPLRGHRDWFNFDARDVMDAFSLLRVRLLGVGTLGARSSMADDLSS